jgi:hypothetical protein
MTSSAAPLRIRLQSVGGFTGLPEIRTIDVAELPEAAASAIRAHLAKIQFFELPSTLLKHDRKSSDFQYTMSVEDGARAHTVDLHKDAVSPALRELIDDLEDLVPPDEPGP